MKGASAVDNVIVIIQENILRRWRLKLGLAQVTPSTVGNFNEALRAQSEALKASDDPALWEAADELESYLIEARDDFRIVVLPEERIGSGVRMPGVPHGLNRWVEARLRRSLDKSH